MYKDTIYTDEERPLILQIVLQKRSILYPSFHNERIINIDVV